jgi:hypothetical protein
VRAGINSSHLLYAVRSTTTQLFFGNNSLGIKNCSFQQKAPFQRNITAAALPGPQVTCVQARKSRNSVVSRAFSLFHSFCWCTLSAKQKSQGIYWKEVVGAENEQPEKPGNGASACMQRHSSQR